MIHVSLHVPFKPLKYFFIAAIFILAQKASAQISHSAVEVVKFDWYENLRNVKNDTTYIVNFWATWCVPCVAELPSFEKITSIYKTQKVKIILVSLDFVKTVEKQLKPFLQKKNMQSKVVLLDEPDYNAWIDKVDTSWTGSLPATIIFNNKKGFIQFFEKEFTFVALDSIIQKNIVK